MGTRDLHSPSQVLVRAIVCLLVDQLLFLELRFSGWWAMSPHSGPQSRVWLVTIEHRSSLGDSSSSLIHPARQALDCGAVLLDPSLAATTPPSSCVSSPATKVGTRIAGFGERIMALPPGIQCVYKHPLLRSSAPPSSHVVLNPVLIGPCPPDNCDGSLVSLASNSSPAVPLLAPVLSSFLRQDIEG